MRLRRFFFTLLLFGAALASCAPSSPERRAQALLDMGDPVRACALLEQAVTDDPADAGSRALLLKAL
ncbi:MAG: hypothetical protein QME74_01855, partial [Candidatus Edwardsbacteria bacterium]|nr:hypothetical protein [Candidatus Edwardsbacteria bacterium]